MLDTETIQVADWVVRMRVPEGRGPFPVILLLHGWTGDENSMWIFARNLPPDTLLLAPRAPHESPIGGHSWYPMRDARSWPSLDDFEPAVNALLDFLDNWPAFGVPAADFSKLRLAGFSQGAALTYTLGLIYPERVTALAGLAGFLPEGSNTLFSNQPLKGIPIYISHGSTDELVPVEKARQAVQFFDQMGADVTYCESDAGHKLSADCFRGMEAFFE
jgi:phospholipase/carboxylesterase